MSFEYTKQPWEEEIIGVDFSRRVPAGITVNPVATDITDVVVEETVSICGLPPDEFGSHIVVDTPVLTGVVGKEKILAAMISGGVTGFKYRLSFRITLSDSQKKEDDVWVIIKEI